MSDLIKKSKKYLEVEQAPNATHIKVEVYYSKGGMNYFSATNEKRGIWVSVSPVTRKENSESYMGFSGSKKHLLDMNRFSQKTLDNFTVDNLLEKQIIDYVCEKNGLKLKENLELS